MTIGERIRDRRTALGLTLEELGEKVEESKQNIYKYEKGTITNIPLEKINKIAEALGVTPAYLAGWNEPEMIEREAFSRLLRSIPFFSFISKCCQSRNVPFSKIEDYFIMPENAAGLDLIVRYSSLKKNDEIFLLNTLNLPSLSALSEYTGLNPDDFFSLYSRDEVNIIRTYRHSSQEVRNTIKSLCNILDPAPSDEAKAKTG